MSTPPTSRSADLERLVDEGHVVRVEHGLLVVEHVPYATAGGAVAYGALISSLNMNGEVAAAPTDHVAHFAGELPHDENGQPFTPLFSGTTTQELAPGIVINYSISQKLPGEDGQPRNYVNYYEKMRTYIDILGAPAQAIDSNATARVGTDRRDPMQEQVFKYPETASGRAGIGALTAKLSSKRVAIVGCGGTGAYVLDFVAKTPVDEIHLFDADILQNHNAYRMPGAVPLTHLEAAMPKVAYLSELYSNMRLGVEPHIEFIGESNVVKLESMDFVFLCMDGGSAERLTAERLIEAGVPFASVGMGVVSSGNGLTASLRTTVSTAETPVDLTRLGGEIDDEANEYVANIQIVELNAINAGLAVVEWKKLCGFYASVPIGSESIFTTIDSHIVKEGDGK